MSGLFSKLKNKVAFKVNQAVDDPEAQKYAKEQEKEKNKEVIPRVKSIEEIRKERMEELKKTKGFSEKTENIIKELSESAVKKFITEGKSEKDANKLSTEYFNETVVPLLNKELDNLSSPEKIISLLQDELDQLTDTSDPNTISPSRIAKKFWRYLTLFIEKAFVPFLAIVLSMYVANESIVYPAPIRGIFFVLTFIMCMMYSPIALGLGLFYLAKKGYSYYVNEISGKEKRRIMPTIFAMLPITTYQPEGGLESFFLYPFTYPKSKQDEEELPKIMKEYQDALDASFPYLEKIKGLPFVAEGLELIKNNLETLHVPKEEEVKETAPDTVNINDETRKKFNALTSNQLPPTISQTPPATNKGSNQTSSATNNKQEANQSSVAPPPPFNNKGSNQTSSATNNKQEANQSSVAPPPPFNNKGSNQVVPLPPTIENKGSTTEVAPTNNKGVKNEITSLPSTIENKGSNQSPPPVNTQPLETKPPSEENAKIISPPDEAEK